MSRRRNGLVSGFWTFLLLLALVFWANVSFVSVESKSSEALNLQASDARPAPQEYSTSSMSPTEWSKTYGYLNDTEAAYSVVETSDGGFALAGCKKPPGVSYQEDFWLVKTDSAGNMQWNKTYGNEAYGDVAYSVIQTNDGGYALVGSTNYWEDALFVKTDSNGDVQWSKMYAGWEGASSVVQTDGGGYALVAGGALLRIDAAGNMQWYKTYGAGRAYSVVQTRDGGYSLGGEVIDPFGYRDFWLGKTDSHGNLQWNKTYGGADEEWVNLGSSLVQTTDGGYALAGLSASFGGYWFVKTDSAGNMLWNKTYTGVGWINSLIQTFDGGYAFVSDQVIKIDSAGNLQWNKTLGGYSIVQTLDGGYAVAGEGWSKWGSIDFRLVRFYEPPPIEWSRTYGWEETSEDFAYSMIRTSDGGYALAGYTVPYGVSGPTRFWFVKTDSTGNMVWNKTYGGRGNQVARSIIQTGEGGYALAGYNATWGASDVFFVRTDADGNLQWSKSYGGWPGGVYYKANSVVETSDGGFVMVGSVILPVGGYYSPYSDIYLFKIDADGYMQWNKTYGIPGAYSDDAFSVIETSDGFAIAGYTGPYYNFCLIKTNREGDMEWNQTYGPGWAYSIVQTSDEGYALAGYTGVSAWAYPILGPMLVKTDAAGNMLWNRTYGFADDIAVGGEVANSVVQTSDGGFALAGYSIYNDFWFVKTDSDGNVQWSQNYGGYLAYSVVETNDGGYALAGYTNFGSPPYDDFLLIKVGPPLPPVHDIAINRLVTSKTVAEQGDIVTINVALANQGDYMESFNIAVYANATTIQTRSVTLASRTRDTISLSWNTTSFHRGNYTISAYLSPVPDELDTEDNLYVGGTVQIMVLDTVPPIANAGADQTVNEDTLVTFDGSASTDENGIVTYTWTFTDTTLQTLSGKNPTHTFATPGVYTITLKVTDPAGNTATDTVTITVLDVTKPVANAGSDRTVNEDTQITLDGSASSDNVAITAYTWTFTDLTIKTLTGEKPTYTFNTPGVYAITLNVTDAAGNWATNTITITVLDITKPVANAGQDQTVNVGATVTFDASSSTDNVGVISYQWDFGDGTTGAGKTTGHTYSSPGTYTVTLTVKDAANNSATHSVTVTVLSTEAFPMWIIGATIAVIAATAIAATATLLLRKRK